MCVGEREESPCDQMHLSLNKMQREFANAFFVFLLSLSLFSAIIAHFLRHVRTVRTAKTLLILPLSQLSSRASISPTFYEPLLGQLIYAAYFSIVKDMGVT